MKDKRTSWEVWLRVPLSPTLFEESVVAFDRPVQQHVFNSRPCADVMDNQTLTLGFRKHVCHHPDMVNAAAQIPRHNVAGKIVVRLGCNGKRFTLSREIGHEIRNASMIDVAVRRTQPPALWILRELPRH